MTALSHTTGTIAKTLEALPGGIRLKSDWYHSGIRVGSDLASCFCLKALAPPLDLELDLVTLIKGLETI